VSGCFETDASKEASTHASIGLGRDRHLVRRFGAERVIAERAGATTLEIESSHVAMISHPVEVTSLVRDAVTAVAG
jgi:hypothetical protein